jgi:PAS domain S-box-containing protein
MEEEIKETRDFLESVVEGSRDGIAIVDEKGYIISVNTAMEQITGCSREELIGKHGSLITPQDKEHKQMIQRKVAELFEQGHASYESYFESPVPGSA